MPPGRPRRSRRKGDRSRSRKRKPKKDYVLPGMEERDHEKYQEDGPMVGPVEIIAIVVLVLTAIVSVVLYLIGIQLHMPMVMTIILVTVAVPPLIRCLK